MPILAQVDPDRIYPLVEATRLLPPGPKGKPLGPSFFLRMRAAGHVMLIRMQCGKKGRWFIRGSELERMFVEDQPRTRHGDLRPQTSAQVARDRKKLAADLARHGITIPE